MFHKYPNICIMVILESWIVLPPPKYNTLYCRQITNGIIEQPVKKSAIINFFLIILIMYNFIFLTISGQNVACSHRKHEYKSSFSIAIYVCCEFIRDRISQDNLIRIILKYLTPIRPSRKSI